MYNAPTHSRNYEYDYNRDQPSTSGPDQYYDEPEVEGHDSSPPEQAPEQAAPPRREFKYSTAAMPERSRCHRIGMILLTCLVFLLIMVAISILMNRIFFDGVSDNAPTTNPTRDENETFPLNQADVSGACSTVNLQQNKSFCQELCEPQYTECCQPFRELDIFSDLTLTNGTVLNANKNVTADRENATCTLADELRGCVSYAKCQALSGEADAAPAALQNYCKLDQLSEDPDNCQTLCSPHACCYSTGQDNCLTTQFDICLDYAPCQNLRDQVRLEVAPGDLDHACFLEQPECYEICQQAACCNDPVAPCLQDNFLTCLTYAPCNQVVSRTNITLPPQFNLIPPPPVELIFACQAPQDFDLEPPEISSSNKTCSDYCTEVYNCWSPDRLLNIFAKDPLGCLAWQNQCQVNFQ